MGKKITSYQKLLNKNKALKEDIDKLLSDPEYLLTRIMQRQLMVELNNRALFGEVGVHTGEIKFDGILKDILDNES